jgi:hypothetical protein
MIGILVKHLIFEQCLQIAFDRVGLNLAKVSPAIARRLRAKYTIMMADDIQSFHGVDIQRQMMEALSYEIQSELDREILGRTMALAERYAGTMG